MTKTTTRRPTAQEKAIAYCDTCRHATYDMQHKNLSIYGTPTLVICALHPSPKIVVGTIGCCKYEPKA